MLFEIVLLPFAHLRQAVGPKWGSKVVQAAASAVVQTVVTSHSEEVVLESATVESVQVTIVASEGEMVDVV